MRSPAACRIQSGLLFHRPCRLFPRSWIAIAGVWLLVFRTFCGVAAEVIPPSPAKYFNDYAGVVSPDVAQRLNQTLEEFERSTSSQILVVVYPKMQSDSSIEDYTVRVAESWKVG